MNSSISSSRIFRIVGLFALTVCVPFLLTSATLKAYVLLRTDTTHFSQTLDSKTRHMHLNLNDKKTDIIFIGNSRTEYHIDTATFKKRGMSAYNYGVSGTALPNYYFMSTEAAELKPKIIVIGLQAIDLYSDDLVIKRGLTLRDFSSLLTSHFNFTDKLRAVKVYFSEINAIRTYADQIYDRINSIYALFSPKILAGAEMLETKTVNIPGCDIASADIIKEGMTSYRCTNGDFILDGTDSIIYERMPQKLDKPNRQKIAFLNEIFAELQAQGIKPVLLLEPVRNFEYIYNTKDLSGLDAHIIDMTSLKFHNDLWAEGTHLNKQGRMRFSTILAREIQDLK